MTEVTADRVISKLNELNLHLSPEINYRVETVFPRIEGMFLNREIRKKFQLVQRIEPVLRELLLEHEQVQVVSKGKEKLLHTAMVFTNYRIVCFRMNSKGEPKQAFSFLYYTQIDSLKTTNSWSSRDDLTIALKDGGKLTVSTILKTEREAMLTAFQNAQKVLTEQGFDPSVSQSRENLCGNCLQVVPKDQYQCAACGATFWKPREIVSRYFLFPPWGGFVMKLYLMAAIHLAYLILIMILISISLMRSDYGFPLMIIMVVYIKAAMNMWFIANNGLYQKKFPQRI
ncbi:hypothetical protein [uncultured Gimesia sp.]|uniref:hypothetical protein n=1 Tax=uncultured Gimesia sp. TaxID=1678688 RepID=UPI0030D899D5|tara:strand:- start:9292 stop:10149 length:858 start_codon:yes stop_codon:yes gene_type:complete